MNSTMSESLFAWAQRSFSSTECILGIAPPEPAPAKTAPIESAACRCCEISHSRFLHVVEQGAVLHRSGSRIRVMKKEAVLLDVPVAKLQGVLIYGGIQISTQCLRCLLSEGVWVAFFTRSGTYKGRLQPAAEEGGRLRLRQWERSRDPQFCLDFARAVVRGKILGQKQVAAAYSKNYLVETLGEGHKTLCENLGRIGTVQTMDELRGIEGSASRVYFDMFRRWNRSEMSFEGRAKPNAADPINALLNLGYMLLTREVAGLVESAGLDPTIGFYHLPDNNRPSLACDWVEEFRHPVVDRLVLRLINKKIIGIADFEVRGERGGLRMTAEALRRFLGYYERVMVGAAKGGGEESEKPPGYRMVVLEQLGRLMDAISGKAAYCTHLEQQT